MTSIPTAADPMTTLRRRTSAKWRTYPEDVLPMFVAEMDFPLAPAIAAALHEAIELGDTGYVGTRDADAEHAFRDFAATRWGWSPDPKRMRTTTDVSVVIVESLRRLAGPGDGVIITPPVYPPFYDLIPEAGASVVEVPLRDDGASFALDLEGIDRALAAGAKGVLLCSPHNPVGLVHDRATLEELSAIVARYDGFVLADEIHAPLTHGGGPFTPYLSVSDEARAHGIAAESGSKAFNLAGLKTAFFVAASDRMTELIRGLPDEVTYRTGHFGLIATREGFAHGSEWLDGTIAAIEANVDHLEAELAATLPAVRLRRPSAGFLAWLDMSALGWGDDPSVTARRKGRVALASGPAFGAQGAGHARMNIACAPETITEAVSRLAAVQP
ncbi:MULTISPECIES: aminotransferase class I/II-fold pyridoxal phosphate-dependent enzyme [Microbacterium]|uniref:MalY/PatB family protein n=1 Tax=Microbacterium TaxID=33882 RepID=UPI001661715C|nr:MULTISPECIES: aminotransferase class I/II-fold pyridoxal phosphate-dependent enzyme [Microbacterium]